MESYFVVLQLPGSDELKFTDDKNPSRDFWKKAGHALLSKEAKIVCIRKDTGVSEALRKHVGNCSNFKTYVLFHMELTKEDLEDNEQIFDKAASLLEYANYDMLIDADENFQLLTTNYLDINNLNVNY